MKKLRRASDKACGTKKTEKKNGSAQNTGFFKYRYFEERKGTKRNEKERKRNFKRFESLSMITLPFIREVLSGKVSFLPIGL